MSDVGKATRGFRAGREVLGELARSEVISIRVSKDEKVEIFEAAREAGMNTSDFIRMIFLQRGGK